jgi:hypothetical protein
VTENGFWRARVRLADGRHVVIYPDQHTMDGHAVVAMGDWEAGYYLRTPSSAAEWLLNDGQAGRLPPRSTKKHLTAVIGRLWAAYQLLPAVPRKAE